MIIKKKKKKKHSGAFLNNNIGIKHGFPCINVCQVPREMLKTEAVGRGFQHLPRDLANVYVLENNVGSLLLHKFNDLFVKIWETIWHYILSPFVR